MKEFVRYLVASAIGQLTWEIAQLPLYTIWSDGTPGLMAWAIVHCTGGDLLIAASCFALARPISGRWLAPLLVASGVAYTIVSEWWNVEAARSWAYSDLMPRLPWLGTGLSPLFQWLVVPCAALLYARRERLPGPASVALIPVVLTLIVVDGASPGLAA